MLWNGISSAKQSGTTKSASNAQRPPKSSVLAVVVAGKDGGCASDAVFIRQRISNEEYVCSMLKRPKTALLLRVQFPSLRVFCSTYGVFWLPGTRMVDHWT